MASRFPTDIRISYSNSTLHTLICLKPAFSSRSLADFTAWKANMTVSERLQGHGSRQHTCGRGIDEAEEVLGGLEGGLGGHGSGCSRSQLEQPSHRLRGIGWRGLQGGGRGGDVLAGVAVKQGGTVGAMQTATRQTAVLQHARRRRRDDKPRSVYLDCAPSSSTRPALLPPPSLLACVLRLRLRRALLPSCLRLFAPRPKQQTHPRPPPPTPTPSRPNTRLASASAMPAAFE